jgi:hypothetical protein
MSAGHPAGRSRGAKDPGPARHTHSHRDSRLTVEALSLVAYTHRRAGHTSYTPSGTYATRVTNTVVRYTERQRGAPCAHRLRRTGRGGEGRGCAHATWTCARAVYRSAYRLYVTRRETREKLIVLCLVSIRSLWTLRGPRTHPTSSSIFDETVTDSPMVSDSERDGTHYIKIYIYIYTTVNTTRSQPSHSTQCLGHTDNTQTHTQKREVRSQSPSQTQGHESASPTSGTWRVAHPIDSLRVPARFNIFGPR